MIVAGHYPSRRQATVEVALQAEPYLKANFSGPEAWGCAPPLVWRAEKHEDGYAAVGRSLKELKALSNG